jgi:hypothetical protein
MRCRRELAVSLVPSLLYFMRINPSINGQLNIKESVMIKDPAAELCRIALRTNVLRKEVYKVRQRFNKISPKCEWFITGKFCCNDHHHHDGANCDLMTCPITEIKEDPSS